MNKTTTRHFFKRKTIPLASALMIGLTVPALTYAASATDASGPAFLVLQQQVTGTVSSSEGPLPGATVSVKENPTVATSTDDKGQFTIQVTQGQTLQFRAIGYATVEQIVDGTSLQVVLQADNQTIDEVVVVGFGTQKKANLTGAVQSIDSKDLEDRPVTNVSSALQGKFAGVTIIQNSGQPGKDNGSVRIRGLGTVNNADI